MIYGDINNLIRLIKNKMDNSILNEKERINKDKLNIKKSIKKLFIKKKNELINLEKHKFNVKKRNILFNYNIKKLELKEDIKNNLLNELINKIINKFSYEKKNKTNFYISFINDVILKGINILGGKEFVIKLNSDDFWIIKKLNGLSKYNIKFIKDDNFNFGAIIYKEDMKELVNNSLINIIKLKHDDLYKLVDGELKWVE